MEHVAMIRKESAPDHGNRAGRAKVAKVAKVAKTAKTLKSLSKKLLCFPFSISTSAPQGGGMLMG